MTRHALPRAVLFDLDGTVADSLPTLERLTNDLLREQGLAPVSRADVRRFVGDGPAKLLERALAAAGWPFDQARFDTLCRTFMARYEASPVEGTVVFPGMGEALERLAASGVALGVVTNKPEAVSHMILERLSIAPFFQVVVGGDSCAEKKPSAMPILHALQALGCPPEASWFVGDSRHDLEAARQAGCATVVLMRYGYGGIPVDTLPADAHADDFHHWLTAAAGEAVG